LLDAIKTLGHEALQAFLQVWRTNLCYELAENPHGHLRYCQPTLSQTIPPSFPDVNILHLYLHPVISPVPFDGPAWIWRNVNIRSLAQLCERSFSWRGTVEITNKFIKSIWGGVCFRQLISVCNKCCNKIHFADFRASLPEQVFLTTTLSRRHCFAVCAILPKGFICCTASTTRLVASQSTLVTSTASFRRSYLGNFPCRRSQN